MPTEFMTMPNPGDRCSNSLCVNLVGQGKWIIVSMPALPVGQSHLPALHLSMCSPCATRLSHEIASEREGS